METGSVAGLRARGGFTVSERWTDGKLVEARVAADRDASVRLRYGQSLREVSVKAGTSVVVTY